MSYIYRFVTPQAVLTAAREKTITDRRAQGYKGPIAAIQLDTKEIIRAFLDYWDMLGANGWVYSGTADYPDLPFGGCYVFRKLTQGKQTIKKTGIARAETESIDEKPLDETMFETIEPEILRDDEVYDMSNEQMEGNEDLIDAPANVVNDILFKRQVILSDRDPDKTSDVIDELENAQNGNSENIPQKEQTRENVRHQLYELFKATFPKKKAVHQGRETKNFKLWLDEKKSAYDPMYKSYNAETNNLALVNEVETKEYKQWAKEQYAKPR